jgi:Glu-tRNA(Gln) amidotransferase subunit E-like FAD-binding protein
MNLWGETFMKSYIFDRSTNIFHDSVRGAERELGKTAAQIAKDSQIEILTHDEVSTAIAEFIHRRERNGTEAKTTTHVKAKIDGKANGKATTKTKNKDRLLTR